MWGLKGKWRYLFVLLMFTCFTLPFYRARAANVSLFTDTLSDPRPTITSNHDIKFKMDTGTTVANTETITLKFNGFTVGTGTLAQADFSVSHDADGNGSYTALTPTTDYTIATVNNATADPTVTITFTTAGGTAIGSNKYLEVVLTNGANKLPNPSAGSYTIDLGGTFGDTGQMQIAIIGGVTTTATISASLSVLVEAVSTGTVNGQAIDIASTAATVPFGIMTVNAFKASAHDITVSTNAAGGYTTTIRQLNGSGMNDVLSSSANNIDGFRGTAGTATNAAPLAWAAGDNPTGTSANVNTGWYGYTTEDATLGTGTPGRFSANKWAPFDSTAYEIMYESGPINAQKIRIGHMLEANALQPQGSYTGVVEYISTAIF